MVLDFSAEFFKEQTSCEFFHLLKADRIMNKMRTQLTDFLFGFLLSNPVVMSRTPVMAKRPKLAGYLWGPFEKADVLLYLRMRWNISPISAVSSEM